MIFGFTDATRSPSPRFHGWVRHVGRFRIASFAGQGSHGHGRHHRPRVRRPAARESVHRGRVPHPRVRHRPGDKVGKLATPAEVVHQADPGLRQSSSMDAPRTGSSRPTGSTGSARPIAVLVCVPTPLTDAREPDLTLRGQLGPRHRRHSSAAGQLVVLESTTYPTTTRNDVLPVLERTGLTCRGRTSSWRSARSGKTRGTRRILGEQSIPKVVGGLDAPRAAIVAEALYSAIVPSGGEA